MSRPLFGIHPWQETYRHVESTITIDETARNISLFICSSQPDIANFLGLHIQGQDGKDRSM